MFIFRSSYLLVLLSTFVIVASPTSEDEVTLYEETDPVWILQNDTFVDTLEAQPEILWLVQFYNSWCGHCRNFAPHFKILAHSIIDWGEWVQLAVIDCAAERNAEICMNFEVRSYPNLKFFVPKRNSTDIGMPLKLARRPSRIRVEIMDLIKSISHQPRRGNVAPWPSLQLVSDELTTYPWKIDDDLIHILVVDYPEATSLGDEFIVNNTLISDLRFHHLNVAGEIGRVVQREFQIDVPSVWSDSKSRTTLLVAIRNQTVLQKVLIQDTDTSTTGELLLQFDEFLSKLPIDVSQREKGGAKMRAKVDAAANQQQIESRDSESLTEEAVKVQDDSVLYYVDLEKTLSYMLRHEVPLSKHITGDQFESLVEWVNVLRDFLPVRPPVKSFLTNLATYLNNPRRDRSISGLEFRELYNRLASQSNSSCLPDYEEYIHCRGSTPQYRGYTCGLWSVFHSLTVASAVSTDQVQVLTKEEAQRPLLAVLGYVTHFFSCEHCSRHFQQMAKDELLREKVVDRTSGIYWLWRAHNKVNVRLSGDITEDPAFPKRVYPAKPNCRACSTPSAERTWDGDEWDLDSVLQYLTSVYGQASISSSGTQEYVEQLVNSLAAPKLAAENQDVPRYPREVVVERQKWVIRDYFSSAEITFCMTLYFFSTLLLMMACMCVAKRRLWLRARKRYLINTDTPFFVN